MATQLTPSKKQFKNIQEIYNYAENQNDNLHVGDLDHTSACEIEHRDGSKFYLTNVHMELVRFTTKTFDETVYIAYSEHHQPLVYMESDLVSEPKIIPLGKKKLVKKK